MKNIFLGVGAASLALSPIAATAAQPVALDRASIGVGEGEDLEGENGIIIILLGAAAVIAGILIIADGDDEPTSP